MPKRVHLMSARAVDSLRCNGRYAVGGVVGLYLAVRGLSRSCVLRIKVHGRRHEWGLGSYPEVSLARARDRAWARRRARLTVMDQIPNDTASSAEPAQVLEERTFEFCARTYIAAQAPGWKSAKHAKQWLSTLEQYAFPVIGRLNVAEIATKHLLQILQPIWSTQTETATRLRGYAVASRAFSVGRHIVVTEVARTRLTGRKT